MFKGLCTQVVFEKCMNQGLCEKHSADLHQSGNMESSNEWCRLALLYIRRGILNPFLFNRPGNCQKVEIFIQKANFSLLNFTGDDVSEDALKFICTLDSVIVFSACYIAKVCCLGALFQTDVRVEITDPETELIDKLLHADLKEVNINNFIPIMLRNFSDCDSNVVKLFFVSTILFIRNNCIKTNVKTAVEDAQNSIPDNLENKIYQKPEEYMKNGKELTDIINIYRNELKYVTPYNAELFRLCGQSHLLQKKYVDAYFYFYVSIMLKPSCEVHALVHQTLSNQPLRKSFFKPLTSFGCEWSKHEKCLYCNTQGQSCEKATDGIKKITQMEEPAKTVHKNNSLPELIEASDTTDSESEESSYQEALDIPHLVKASDSEGSSVETDSINEERKSLKKRIRSKKSKSSRAKAKRKIPEALIPPEKYEEVEAGDAIHSLLKEASEALLQGCGYKALQLYCGKLKKVIESPEAYGFVETDSVCIKYSCGIAYCQSGGFKDLERCIEIFQDIIENHESVTFPAVYYALGLAFRKLNRFKDALGYLKTVKSILNKGIQFKVYPWPSLTAVINETRSSELQVLVDNLIKECENPRNPDAICRLSDCNLQPNIYYSDPDFKGYVSIFCSEQCSLQYHFDCWKTLKIEKNLSDKEFLDQACFTPDCDGRVAKLQFIDKKGDINKQFLSELKKEAKSKSTKWEKKTETKEKKKKKAHSSRSESQESERVASRKNSDATEGMSSLNSLDNQDLNTVRKHENNTYPPDNDVPASSYESVKECVVPMTCNSLSDEAPTSENKSQNCDIKPTALSSEIIECIKKNIYLFMSDFLQLHGPLKIDDPYLVKEMSSFPEDALILITECGGIGEFLKNDLRFGFVGNSYICVTSDLGKAYELLYSPLTSDVNDFDEQNMNTIRHFDGSGDASLRNYCLNPNAVEYLPPGKGSLAFGKASEDVKRIPSNSVLKETNLHEVDEILPITSEDSVVQATENEVIFSSDINSIFSEKDLGLKLCALLNLCFSESMKEHHQYIDSCIKPFVVQNAERIEKERKVIENEKQDMKLNIIELKSSNDILIEQKSLLQKQLHLTKEQKQEFFAEVSVLKKKLEDRTEEFEEIQKECMEKEAKLQEGRKFLLESLSKAYESIHTQKKEIEALKTEKQSMKKNIDELKSSFQSSEDKFKNAISKQKEEHAQELQVLQAENEELKNKLQKADLMMLYIKKSEYLKKIEEKCAEALKNQKGLKDCYSAMGGNINPVMQAGIKQLDSQLSIYMDQLVAIKLDYVFNIDDQIERVKNGAHLMELKEFEVKELKDVPSFESLGLIPAMSPSSNKQPAYNAGVNMGVVPPGLLTSVIPPVAASTIPPVAASTIPPVAASTIPPVAASTIPPVAASTIPPVAASTIPPVAASTIPPVGASTIPPVGASTIPPVAASIIPPVAASTNLPVAASTNPPVGASTNPAVGASTNPPVAASTNPPVGASTNPPVGASTNPPVAASTNPPVAASTNPLVAASTNPPVAASTNPYTAQFAFPIISSCATTKFPSTSLGGSKLAITNKNNGSLDDIKHNPLSRKYSLNSSSNSLHSANGFISKNVTSKPSSALSSSALGTLPIVSPAKEKKAVPTQSKNNYEKLLNRLHERFPSHSQEDLIGFIKELRAQRQGKLSGLPVDAIITHVGAIINAKEAGRRKVLESRNQAKNSKQLINKKLIPESKPIKEPSVKKKPAWNIIPDSQKQWSGNCDECCVICYEDMSSKPYKVACGHAFHEICIKQWLEKKSDCPICRVLLLLPEDYPSLS